MQLNHQRETNEQEANMFNQLSFTKPSVRVDFMGHDATDDLEPNGSPEAMPLWRSDWFLAEQGSPSSEGRGSGTVESLSYFFSQEGAHTQTL